MNEIHPPSGRLHKGRHFFPLRVYVHHTDAGGVVYHNQYLCFAEQARTEFLRLLDVPYHQLREQEKGLIVVREASLSYLMPARLDDFLEVRTYLKKVGGASLIMQQDIIRKETLLVHIRIRLGWINAEGVATRLPGKFRQRLLDFLVQWPLITEIKEGTP